MDEMDTVIKNVIREGFLPEASDFSMYITLTCSRGRWKEATELMDLALGA
ncbi:hypothetical protein HPP92_010088 [Vanilla planifolia]|uniref:Pentatricopeptide repeat-containing protein n=1 Tax=Vanilla planifolia TaxID=51239 RepID=A0A835V0G8_VANPL|nr:hypothetical protein HPP92_010088 [Vanilla planifolia]